MGSVRGLVAVLSVLAALAASATLLVADPPHLTPIGVLGFGAVYVAAFLFAQRFGFVLHWRGHSTKVSLEEFALVGGLLLAPAPALVAATAIGSIVHQVVTRRPPVKAVFNVAQYTFAASIAIAVFHAGLGAGLPPLVAVLAGPYAYSLTSQALMALVFSRLEAVPFRRVFRSRFLAWALLGGTIGLSLGLGAYALWTLHPLLLLAILPVFLLLARFGRLTEWADEEIRVHKALAETTTRVAATGEFGQVADTIVDTCANVLGAGEARLELPDGDAEPAVWHWRHPQGAAGPAMRVVVPTSVGAPGELVLVPRPGQRAYGERDRHLLMIVAATAASAAAGSRALAELREANLRLSNANRELDEFTLWTTHDMREPLRSVGQLAQMLHEEIDQISKDEARDLARRVHRGAESLKERIKALHEFSRVVQENVPFERVELDEVFATAEEELAARLAERHGRIHVEGPLPVVRAQRARLQKVVGNLLENALKHNDKDDPVVHVACSDRGAEWEFSVRDNGPGIPVSYRERVFKLFQRGAAREAGSGAGLAIVKRIVEQHGGRVWIEGCEGVGADFRFTIPKGGQPPAATQPPLVRLVG